MTVKAFCASQGVSEPSFYSWRRRFREPSGAIPFAVIEPGRSLAHLEEEQGSMIELVLAGGDRLRIPSGADASTLHMVLRLVKEHRA